MCFVMVHHNELYMNPIEYLFYRGGFGIKVLWQERPKPIQDYTWLKERPRKRAENGKWLKGHY
jgi:hypothetical protein